MTQGRAAHASAPRPELLDRVESLPSLSSVVLEFLRVTRRDYFTARDFERVIVKDQALVARLLKVANSGFFCRSRSIKTIPEAVVLVGLDNMKSMVYSVSSGGMMRRRLSNYRYHEKGFWLHAMGVGMLCRALSEASPGALRGEAAFVAGLLHDTAKLILDDFLPAGAGPRLVDLEEERRTCGLDHSELAEHLLTRWNIPADIVQAVRWHHDPAGAADADRPAAALVHLADAVAGIWGIGVRPAVSLEEEIEPEEHVADLAAIGLESERLQRVLHQAREKLARLDQIYLAD